MKTRISLATPTCPKMMAGRFRTICTARLPWLLLLLALPAAVQAQYNYTTNNGAITITGYTGAGGAVTIPSTINGLPVTSIGYSAFYLRTSLTSVTIPNSVTNIGNSAFEYCAGLTNITIGDGVTTLGNSVFRLCTNLTSVAIPNSVTTIGIGAFIGCYSLTSVTIGNSVTTIGSDAFGGCDSLTSVTIGDSVTSIGNGAFSGCDSLTAIMVDALNSFYSSLDGVLFNKSQTTLIQCPGGKAGSYAIPNSVTNIGSWAFESCSGLTSVTIGDSVTSIANFAFFYCTGLTSVTIGNGVTSIGAQGFDFCTKLTSISFGNSLTSIANSAFSHCGASLTGVYFKGNACSLGSNVFKFDPNAIIYYLPGTTGWGETFGGRPAVLWNPQAKNLGVALNQFGFTITGSSNLVIVVEACTDLANLAWSPLGTNILTGGSSYFSDPQWTNYPARFYRLRAP